MSCNNRKSGPCCPDTPYPQVSHESVPSLIDNLVNALYGTITKCVKNGRVIWNIPCDPSSPAIEILGIQRQTGEGLLCYIIRALSSTSATYEGTFIGSLIGNATSATNLYGGLLNSIPYQTAPNTTSFLSAGSNGQVLGIVSNALQWVNAPSATSASNVIGGNAGQLLYQSAPNTTAFTATGTTGQILVSNGTSAPTWSTNFAGNAATATSATTATTAGSATTAGTANAVVTNGVLTTMIADGNVTGQKLETVSGLTAGTYGSSTQTPVITVDTKGRVTLASQVTQLNKPQVSFFADASRGDVGYISFSGAGVFVDSNNHVRTIGQNLRGRLGTGNDVLSSTASGFSIAQVPKVVGESITKIFVSTSAMFVLTDFGNVYSCGANVTHGALGVGDLVDRNMFTKTLVLSNIVDLSISNGADADAYHGLAVTSTGALYAWGNNGVGQLGDGTLTSKSTPTLISSGAISGKTITKCYAFGGGTAGYSFVLDSNNDIYSTGYNGTGNLGLGDTTNRNAFVKVATLKASAVYGTQPPNVTYPNSSVFILWQGNLWGTGENSVGELGVNDTIDKSSFTALSGISNVASLTISNTYAATGASVAALLTDGTIRSWGKGTEGALGTGSFSNANSPQPLSGVSGLQFSKIQMAGYSNTGSNFFALSTTGVLYVCGYQNRAFGDGIFSANRSTFSPARVPINTTFTDFRVYGDTTSMLVYAKSNINELWAWGKNDYEQTSTNSGAQVSMPQKALVY